MNYKDSLDYKECTDREKVFLDLYLNPSKEDTYLQIEAATIAAFQISPSNALAYGRGILGRERIKRIVESELETPLPTREQFLRTLWKNATTSKDGKQTLGALQLFADVSGWRVRTAARPKSAEDEEKDSPLKDLVYRGDSETEIENDSSIS